MRDPAWLGDIATPEGFEAITRVMAAVSGYAAQSRVEFVAEVYSGLVVRRQFPEWVMELYRQLGGPMP
jgi:hypothetical protein